MSLESGSTRSPPTSTGAVRSPPARRTAKRWKTWTWARSRYGTPARSRAQRAFSQKWLIGIVIRTFSVPSLIGLTRREALFGGSVGERRFAERREPEALATRADAGAPAAQQTGHGHPLQRCQDRVDQRLQAGVIGMVAHQPLDDL